MTIPANTARRGYHRSRPAPDASPLTFELGQHRFETSWRDLWVTLPGEQRVERIKVTRAGVCRSSQRGYPKELTRSSTVMTMEQARGMAAFWLSWKDSPAAAEHPPVKIDHHQRRAELELMTAGAA